MTKNEARVELIEEVGKILAAVDAEMLHHIILEMRMNLIWGGRYLEEERGLRFLQNQWGTIERIGEK
jgi:hypothetical protein